LSIAAQFACGWCFASRPPLPYGELRNGIEKGKDMAYGDERAVGAGRRRLPVGELVFTSIRHTWRHLGYVLRIGGLWLLLVVGLDLAQAAWEGADSYLPTLLFAVAHAFLMAPLAVAWHRFILAGEVMPGFNLQFTRRAGEYFLYAVLVEQLMLAPQQAVLSQGVQQPGEAASGFAALFLLLVPVTLYVSTRLSLVLPAKALGLDGFGLAAAWAMGRGNGWRLACGMLLVFALLILPWVLLLTALVGEAATASPPAAVTVLVWLVGSFSLIVSLTFLSHAFLWLFDEQGIGRDRLGAAEQ
jgi:hypothetical protein